jgi:hypothetical protein
MTPFLLTALIFGAFLGAHIKHSEPRAAEWIETMNRRTHT